MDRRLPLLWLAVCAGLAAGQNPSCKPDCTGKEAHEWTVDPTDCHQYYICMWGGRPTDHVLRCPRDHKFDPTHNDCVPDDGCTPSCTTTTTSTCHYECGGDNDLLTNPFDCSAYYLCETDQKHGPFFCPSDRPYFNGRYCVESDGACCRETCVPYCMEGNIQIPDPLDCQSFYICLEKGLASTELHFECKAGMVMDEGKGRCVTRDHCDPVCTAQASKRVEEIAYELEEIASHKDAANDPPYADVAKTVEETRYKASMHL
ncbi:uncharacterized protein [Panulirus ornatus]|uniref:uncharacterized protein n=1 Tax=Panulirus ornatus TaxID=150431 RepID=UPI003A84CDBD